jgi:hypothetical protein
MPLASSNCSPVPLLPALARWRRRSLPSPSLSDRCLRSLVPFPATGCAIPRTSDGQGNSKSCRRPGAWLRSPLAYPRTGNGGRRRSRSLSPPPPPSALPTELDFVVIRSDREARFRARWGTVRACHCHVASPSEYHQDASATAPSSPPLVSSPDFPNPSTVSCFLLLLLFDSWIALS